MTHFYVLLCYRVRTILEDRSAQRRNTDTQVPVFLFGGKEMEFYKRTAWKNKRRAILSRDQYRCTECRRYGKFREANTVHHILPREYFPEYTFTNWNLTSLCSKCHNEMHDRESHQLTDKGWKLLERTARANRVALSAGIKELVSVRK